VAWRQLQAAGAVQMHQRRTGPGLHVADAKPIGLDMVFLKRGAGRRSAFWLRHLNSLR